MDFQTQKVDFAVCSEALWCPVYTRPLHEFRVFEYLQDHAIPAYMPVVPDLKIHNVLKDGKKYTYRKEVSRPMLKSYVFAQLTAEQKTDLRNTKSVNNIWKVPLEEQEHFIGELRGLQMLEALAKSSKVEFRKELQVNDRFCIESPEEFEGVCGYLLRKEERFLWVIKLEFLGRFIEVKIDPSRYKMRKLE